MKRRIAFSTFCFLICILISFSFQICSESLSDYEEEWKSIPLNERWYYWEYELKIRGISLEIVEKNCPELFEFFKVIRETRNMDEATFQFLNTFMVETEKLSTYYVDNEGTYDYKKDANFKYSKDFSQVMLWHLASYYNPKSYCSFKKKMILKIKKFYASFKKKFLEYAEINGEEMRKMGIAFRSCGIGMYFVSFLIPLYRIWNYDRISDVSRKNLYIAFGSMSVTATLPDIFLKELFMLFSNIFRLTQGLVFEARLLFAFIMTVLIYIPYTVFFSPEKGREFIRRCKVVGKFFKDLLISIDNKLGIGKILREAVIEALEDFFMEHAFGYRRSRRYNGG